MDPVVLQRMIDDLMERVLRVSSTNVGRTGNGTCMGTHSAKQTGLFLFPMI